MHTPRSVPLLAFGHGRPTPLHVHCAIRALLVHLAGVRLQVYCLNRGGPVPLLCMRMRHQLQLHCVNRAGPVPVLITRPHAHCKNSNRGRAVIVRMRAPFGHAASNVLCKHQPRRSGASFGDCAKLAAQAPLPGPTRAGDFAAQPAPCRRVWVWQSEQGRSGRSAGVPEAYACCQMPVLPIPLVPMQQLRIHS